jgi:hypothetical protein
MCVHVVKVGWRLTDLSQNMDDVIINSSKVKLTRDNYKLTNLVNQSIIFSDQNVNKYANIILRKDKSYHLIKMMLCFTRLYFVSLQILTKRKLAEITSLKIYLGGFITNWVIIDIFC